MKIDTILKVLKKEYPKIYCPLNFSNPWEMLVSTILSAQTTDKKVNEVTKDLFKKYKKIEDYANVSIKEFEKDIKSIGLFRSKAKNIVNSAKIILNEYYGKIPKIMEELIKLPGVGRKTANVVLGCAFGIVKGIVVDTHVIKFSHNFNLSKEKTADKIEKDLMKILPKKEWFNFPFRVIFHGRECKYKKEGCKICELLD